MKIERTLGCQFPCAIAAGIIVLLAQAIVVAQPAWYTAGQGGFVANTNNAKVAAGSPTVPDFYQHQYWQATLASKGFSTNGWETQSANPNVGNQFGFGWCGYTSYTDLFYDLASQGYTFANLNNPLNAWYNATYGANANVNFSTASNIGIVASFFSTNQPRVPGGLAGSQSASLQKFLNANVNTNAANNGMATLISQIYPVNSSNGLMSYWSYSAGKQVQAGDANSASVFNATNLMLSAGSDLMYQLYASQQTIANNGLWWAGHAVAVSGINVNQNPIKKNGSVYAGGTVYVSDPDSNPTYNAANNPPTLGAPVVSAPSTWPRTNGFPAAAQVTPSKANLPVPNGLPGAAAVGPGLTIPAGYTNYYDDFNFGKTNFVNSGAAPAFNNTYVADIYRVGPSVVKTIKVKVKGGGGGLANASLADTEDDMDITVQMPADSEPVDGVIIEPSDPALATSVDPSADSLVDDTNTSSTWSDAEDTADPFGNALADDAIEYDLSGGNPLEPGDTADIDLATTGDFSSIGYDVLLHFQGDDSDQWLPEQIGGSEYDPSDDPAGDFVPEPVVLAPLFVGATILLSRRRRINGQLTMDN